MHINDHIADAVRDLRGNWRRFESFGWHDEPENPDNWCIVYTTNRDADVLTRSNAAAIERIMSPHVESGEAREESHGHWAVGHVDGYAIMVLGADGQPTAAFRAWVEIQLALADYPVLDEDDFSQREHDEANEVWRECYRPDERIAYIREHREQFEFRSLADMLGCVRGHYFAGWASELLS